MFAFLEDQGFIDQLSLIVSITDKNTAIDIMYSNFEHYAKVVESFYSNHTQVLVLPKVPPISKDVTPAPTLTPDFPTRLTTALDKGKEKFTSLRTSMNADIDSIRWLLTFVRSGTFVLKSKPKQRKLKLPTSISKHFWQIPTTADGNCFYYAISRYLCGEEVLCNGLRALVAHHIHINEDFLEQLPLALGLNTSVESVLPDRNYSEILEVLIMSYLLKRPLNIYTGD